MVQDECPTLRATVKSIEPRLERFAAGSLALEAVVEALDIAGDGSSVRASGKKARDEGGAFEKHFDNYIEEYESIEGSDGIIPNYEGKCFPTTKENSPYL